jgi:DNA-binding XRE family transcriptional regulator
MNEGKNSTKNPDEVFRTMREMLLEAPAEEVAKLAQEAGLDSTALAQTGRKSAESALQKCKREGNEQENIVPLHKGLNSLLVMLRRRDSLDESELAQKADVDEEEIRRIEYDSGYLPSPRTIYKLEKVFGLPGGVLAKLSGAIKHQSPHLEERVMEFAANAKSMGKLTKAERELLNAFVQFLTEQT